MGNYRELELLDHVIVVQQFIECIIENIIRSSLGINEMQYGFMPGRGTTISIVQQMHEKHLRKHKPFCFAFADLEKAFDRVPSWAMQKLGVEEWKIRFFQAMYYASTASSVRISNTFSEKFESSPGFSF